MHMTVTFCGHRNLTKPLEFQAVRKQVCREIEKLIQQGITNFLLVGYGDFDNICVHTVKNFKNKYPNINSVLFIPYINFNRYEKELYDFVKYPPIEFIPKKYAILARNRYMVLHSDIVISYVTHNGGAMKTLEYAEELNKKIIKINAHS